MNAHGMKVSVRAAALGNDLRNLASVAQRWMFNGLQLDMKVGELELAELSATGQREVRHVLARHDLELASVRLELPHEGVAGSDAGKVLWSVERALKASAGVGAKMMCVDLGRLPAVKPEARPKAVTSAQAGLILIPEPTGSAQASADETIDPKDAERWGAADTVLREVGVLADRYGMVLALSSELSSYASLKRAIEGAACPWFGVDLDPVSVLRDRWDLEHVLDAVGGLVRHVRARDAIKGSGGRTQPAAIGKGSTDWGQMIALLSQGAYSGWITVDTLDLQDRAGEAGRARRMLGSDY